MVGVRDRLEEKIERIEEREGEEKVLRKIYEESEREEEDEEDKRMREGRKIGKIDGRIVQIKDMLDVEGEKKIEGQVVRKDEKNEG